MTHSVTSCSAFASVFESQKPMFAWPPPFVLTTKTDLFSTKNPDEEEEEEEGVLPLLAANVVARLPPEWLRLNANRCVGKEREIS